MLWESVGVRDYVKAVPRGAFETHSAYLDRMSTLAIELYNEGYKFEVQCLPDTVDPRPKGGGR